MTPDEQLIEAGGILRHTSPGGSRYYDMPGHMAVRLSDHDNSEWGAFWDTAITKDDEYDVRINSPFFEANLSNVIKESRRRLGETPLGKALETFEATTVRYGSDQEWLEARSKSVGASDTAGILGHGYVDQSAFTVFCEKNGYPIPKEEVDRLRYGKLMETSLRMIFADVAELPCVAAGDNTIWYSKLHDWMSATLDGLTEDPDHGICPVELKNVSLHEAPEWRDGGAPMKFQIQCQHQMFVTGSSRVYLFGWIGGDRPEVRIIERCDKFQDQMLVSLTEFWGMVEENEYPPIDASAATAKALLVLHPDDDDTTVSLPDKYAHLLDVRARMKERILECEHVIRECENRIKSVMGNAAFAVTGDRYASWRTQEKAEYMAKASKSRPFREIVRLPRGAALPPPEPQELIDDKRSSDSE